MAEYLIQKTTLTSIADAIREKTGTTGAIKPTEMASKIGEISVGGGNSETSVSEEPWLDDVCFWDLEGNLIQNIPMNQIQSLTELPTAPTYDNMIFEGWNYTLEDIKTTEYPLDIAPIYSTADGKTHIKLTPYGTSYKDFRFNFTQTVENGVTFDFGDGSAPQTVAGTGAVYITHTFASVQEYEIVISVSNGCVLGLGGGSSAKPFVTKSTSTSNNTYYSRAITDIRIADGVELSANCFYYFYSLKFLTLPKTLETIPTYAINNIALLPCVSVPNSVRTIENYGISYLTRYDGGAFVRTVISLPNSIQSLSISSISNAERIVIPKSATAINNVSYCYRAKRMFMPNGITTVGNSALAQNYNLKKIRLPQDLTSIGDSFLQYSKIESVVIPPNVTTIGTYFLSYSGVEELYIPSSVTTIGASALFSCRNLKRIIVEDGSKLTSVNLSSDATKGIETIFLGLNPPTSSIFLSFCDYSGGVVYVPDEAVESYKGVYRLLDTLIRPISEYRGTIPNYKN